MEKFRRTLFKLKHIWRASDASINIVNFHIQINIYECVALYNLKALIRILCKMMLLINLFSFGTYTIYECAVARIFKWLLLKLK